MINQKVFNTEKNDYETPSLFLGEDVGLFDTVNKRYPDIWKIYKTVKSLDWDESEFDYSSATRDFKTCDPSTYEMMIKTLAWQWEADSVASRISPIIGPMVTSSELWAAWSRITEQECLHSATYSEIVRNSFSNPKVIIDEILSVKQSLDRMDVVSQVMAGAHKASHEYALGLRENNQETYDHAFMFTVAMLCLERIQFMASFAVTFCICDTGLFQPIGKAVQKIAQDELETHVELDKAVLRNEMKTPRGKLAFERNREVIQNLLDEVASTEMRWISYLFSEGRELVGLNEEVLGKWMLFCAKDVYHFFGMKSNDYTFPKTNPLKFMEGWLDMSKTQPSPQEQDIGQYKVGIMVNDDEGSDYDVDF
jgi:ribonucleoside-diphosphate reductase beta chain